jgi:SAM-dependent methyltransferase
MKHQDVLETLSVCPLCGSVKLRPLATPGRWIGEEVFGPFHGRLGLVRCRSCDLRFINPRPSATLLERFYTGETYSCHQPGASTEAHAKADYLLCLLAGLAPHDRPGRLLDFGCGAGDFLVHALRSGWQAFGFEPGQRGREVCLARELKVVGRLEDVTGPFDVIILNHVFEHLADHLATLHALRNLLAPDGHIYIEVPNVRSLRARLSLPILSQRFGFDERYRAFPIHLTYFGATTMRRLLSRAGFQVERISSVGMGLDELLVRPEREEAGVQPPSPRNHTRPERPLRRFLKAAFLGAGLGENLAVICRAVSR